MKKNSAVSELVTKSFLRNELGSLEQKIDGKLSVLKQELKEEIVGEIDKKNEKYKDEVMTKLDDISGQLEDLQEDKVLSIHQTSELRGQVENHEKRITQLEKFPQTA